jgi:hypothetical protein
MHLVRFAQLGLLLATLAACAAPRYQIAYRYEPPTDVAGQSCLVRCEQGLKSCQDTCAANYTVCVQALEPDAQARYADALHQYAAEIAQYRRAVADYHFDLSLGWGYWDGWDGWYGGGRYGHGWPYGYYGPRYYPPAPPRPPSYADELGKLRAAKCDRDCGCLPNYDACFLSCGGIRIPEQRCIANCPPSP